MKSSRERRLACWLRSSRRHRGRSARRGQVAIFVDGKAGTTVHDVMNRTFVHVVRGRLGRRGSRRGARKETKNGMVSVSGRELPRPIVGRKIYRFAGCHHFVI